MQAPLKPATLAAMKLATLVGNSDGAEVGVVSALELAPLPPLTSATLAALKLATLSATLTALKLASLCWR